MGSLQFIGIAAIIFLVYKFIYIPYVSKKQEEKQIIERKIEILSFWHRDMIELFRPHINPAYDKDEDGNNVLTKGWVKVFNRVLYFSLDSELNKFRAEANLLYDELNSNAQTKIQIEGIFKEHREYSEKKHIEKANTFLELRKNFLDYKKLMTEVFSNSDAQLESKEIIKKLSDKLQLSILDATKLFEKLSHHTTGIIFRSSEKENGKIFYRYSESLIDRKTIDDV